MRRVRWRRVMTCMAGTGSPAFASAELEETAEKHVFGDVVISSARGGTRLSRRK
jgi:hypothetical protein